MERCLASDHIHNFLAESGISGEEDLGTLSLRDHRASKGNRLHQFQHWECRPPIGTPHDADHIRAVLEDDANLLLFRHIPARVLDDDVLNAYLGGVDRATFTTMFGLDREALVRYLERNGYRRTGTKKPFPYGDERFGRPLRDDLRFEILEKPLDKAHAQAMLRQLSGRTHQVITAVALYTAERQALRMSTTYVTFRELTDGEISAYWETGEPQDKAGSYAIQGLGAVFVKEIRGSVASGEVR